MSSDRIPARILCLVALSYAALGGLALTLAIPPGYASPIFPAAGLALAVALHLGPKSIPAIWIASLALNTGWATWDDKLTPSSVLLAAGIATGAALQAWLGRYLILRWSTGKWQRLEHEIDLLRFFLRGGVLACLISASCGVASLLISGALSTGDLLYSWWIWYVGDVLGVLLGAPLVIGFLQRNDFGWMARLKTLTAPVLIMLLLTGVTFFSTMRWESERQQSLLDDKGMELASALERRFIVHREILASLARAIEINPDISRAQFDHFTAVTLLDNQDIFALSYNPYVTQAQRAEFERRMAGVYSDRKFQITERNAARQLVRAGDRPVYVPVAYINPLTDNQPALGFDIHSDPKRRSAIERAQDSTQITATEPIRLVQDQQERKGILILAHTFKPGLPADQHTWEEQQSGFGVAVIKIDEMVEIATQGLLSPGLVFSLEDADTEPALRELYRTDPQAHQAPTAWQKTLVMADREWTLKLFVMDAYRQEHRSWLAWGVSAASLLFIALLQIFLLTSTGRTALVQQQVAEQTLEIRAKNEALSLSEKKYRSVVDSIYEVIFQTDSQGMWTFLNPAWTELTGFAVRDSLGRPYLDYVQPDERKTLAALFTSLLRHERDHVRHEACLLDRDGVKRWVEICARPLLDANDQILGVSGAVLDITERHQADEALNLALQKAEAANRAKSQFLATISHEIRTPMNGVQGHLALLKDQTHLLPASSREHLEHADSSAALRRARLDDMLDFSKIDAGKLDLIADPLRLGPLAREIMVLMRGQLGKKSVILQQSIDPELDELVLQGDALRIRQVLMNLVSNAIKFTEEGRIGLAIQLEDVTDKHARIRMTVSDTGIGMTQEQLEGLFQPFTQADSSITRRFGGTGLGLSISQSLIKLMGSEGLKVSSTLGQGATFYFELSLPVLDATVQASQQRPPLGPDTLDQMDVLLVEDNAINIALASAVLEGLGAQVSIATDGQKALDLLERLGPDFDVVLMDMQMPVLDGLSTTRAIRANPDWAQLPIVAMTANAYESDRQACLDAGMNDFMTKPLDRNHLAEVLRKWVKAPTTDRFEQWDHGI